MPEADWLGGVFGRDRHSGGFCAELLVLAIWPTRFLCWRRVVQWYKVCLVLIFTRMLRDFVRL